MLASILPGFREVRSPFAAGALLLAALYVGAHARITEASRPDQLGGGVAALSDLLGPRGRLAVAAVVAYLLGTVYLALMRGAIRQMYVSMLAEVTSIHYFMSKQRWSFRIAAPFSRPSIVRISDFVMRSVPDEVSERQVCAEIILGGGKRLLVKNKDLYIEWDRMQAEAEFRDAVIVPSFVLAVTCLADVDWSGAAKALTGAAVTVVLVVLWVHARRLDREANSMYAHAVADGVVATAAIDEALAALTRPPVAPG